MRNPFEQSYDSGMDPAYAQTLAHLRGCRARLVRAQVPFDTDPQTWTWEQYGAAIAFASAWQQMGQVLFQHAPVSSRAAPGTPTTTQPPADQPAS